MGFLTRQPTSNETPSAKLNPWGPVDGIQDDISVLLGGGGKRCCVCKRVVLNEWLKVKDGKNYCPDHDPNRVVDDPNQ